MQCPSVEGRVSTALSFAFFHTAYVRHESVCPDWVCTHFRHAQPTLCQQTHENHATHLGYFARNWFRFAWNRQHLRLLAGLQVWNHLVIKYLGHWTLSMNTEASRLATNASIKCLANIHYLVTREFNGLMWWKCLQQTNVGVVTPLSSHSRRMENEDVAHYPWMAEGPCSEDGEWRKLFLHGRRKLLGEGFTAKPMCTTKCAWWMTMGLHSIRFSCTTCGRGVFV